MIDENNSREGASPAVAPDGQHGATTRMTDVRLEEIQDIHERYGVPEEQERLVAELLAEVRRARGAEVAAYDRGMVEGFAQMRGQFARDLSDARSTAFQDAASICEAEAERHQGEMDTASRSVDSIREDAAVRTARALAIALRNASVYVARAGAPTEHPDVSVDHARGFREALKAAVGLCEAEAKRCNAESTAAHKRRKSDRSFAFGAAEATASSLADAIGALAGAPAFTIHDDATRPDCDATRILGSVGKDRAANGATFDYTRPCSCPKATLPPDPAGPPCFDRFLCIVCGGLSREESVGCTGVSAVWCPVHGDCTCPTNGIGERSMNAPACPLHGASSSHGDGS